MAKSHSLLKPNLWWRYRDDIFEVWTQGEDKLLEFTNFLNSLHPTIKFTLVYSAQSLNVLDLTLSLDGGLITTDVYSKPTDNHIYLDPLSSHPRHCVKAIPYGIATRIRRNCSSIVKFDKRSSEYQNYLTRRGYKKHSVKKEFDKVRSMPRDEFLSTAVKTKRAVYPLVVDFNPRLPNIGKLIRENLPLLYNCPSLKNLFPENTIIPAFRRPRNLKEIISKRTNSGTALSTDSECGFFCCSRKCDLCNNFAADSPKFSSVATGRSYTIKQRISCTSKNVIYLVTCKKCSLQYVGSTSNEFKVRFRNHKSAMKTNKKTCETAIHFNASEHSLGDFSFIAIEQIAMQDNTDRILLTREAFWSSQLCTLTPHGLNKRQEFNSSKRIVYN